MPKRRYTKPDPIVPDVVPPVYEEVRVPSQVTAECCHQRWFLSDQRVQGMLVIAEATDVKRVREKRV